MSGHLCLKWNNHSCAFLKNLSSLQVKEKYCDATIVCQGKYFPVHRIILSTCSDYFDEIFERIQCPHPYIIFKDIEPREMELLLNFMYQGEVNVIQEQLPSLIKAAESLAIKGLAVPDDLPTHKDGSSSKKRANSSHHDSTQSKRRLEDSTGSKRQRSDSSSEASARRDKSLKTSGNVCPSESQISEIMEPSIIKQEVPDPCDYGNSAISQPPDESSQKNVFNEYPSIGEESVYVKSEEGSSNVNEFDGQPPWNNFEGDLNSLHPQQVGEITGQEDINETEEEGMAYSGDASSFRRIGLELRAVNDTNLMNMSVFRCHLCSYRSKFRSSVNNHVRFTHGKERPFPCHICPSAFTSKKDLRLHMRIHTGEKPHSCPKCSAKFRLKDHLKKHLQKKSQCQNLAFL